MLRDGEKERQKKKKYESEEGEAGENREHKREKEGGTGRQRGYLRNMETQRSKERIIGTARNQEKPVTMENL